MTIYSFPLDLIKVTDGKPLFSAEESAKVIKQAEEEGVDKNEYESGKYRLGGEKMWTIICILIQLADICTEYNSNLLPTNTIKETG